MNIQLSLQTGSPLELNGMPFLLIPGRECKLTCGYPGDVVAPGEEVDVLELIRGTGGTGTPTVRSLGLRP